MFLLMSSWVPTIIEPAWESGFLVEAKEASEKATNLKLLVGMDRGIVLPHVVNGWLIEVSR